MVDRYPLHHTPVCPREQQSHLLAGPPGVHIAGSVNPPPALTARWTLLPVSGPPRSSQLPGYFGSILSWKEQKGPP